MAHYLDSLFSSQVSFERISPSNVFLTYYRIQGHFRRAIRVSCSFDITFFSSLNMFIFLTGLSWRWVDSFIEYFDTSQHPFTFSLEIKWNGYATFTIFSLNRCGKIQTKYKHKLHYFFAVRWLIDEWMHGIAKTNFWFR